MANQTKKKRKASTKKKLGSTSVGRPTGPAYTPKGLEVRSVTSLTRANAVTKFSGLKRAILEVAPGNEEDGRRLEALVKLVKQNDPSLVRMLNKAAK